MSNPLQQSFEYVLQSFVTWWRCVLHPITTAEDIRANNANDRERIQAITTIWFSSFFLSIVISLPIYQQYGLSLGNASFHLCFVLSEYLILLLSAFALHIALRRYGVASALPDTFVIYGAVAAAAGPFITLVTLPATFRMLFILRAARARAADPAVTFVDVVKQVFHPGAANAPLLAAALDSLRVAISLGVAATVALAIASRYRVPLVSTMRATAFAVAVLLPLPLFLMSVLLFTLYYNFMAP